MPVALIGHTGFVGGTILRQQPFEDTYNSSNIDGIRGREYELVVCAGAPGRKWEANQQPERDIASIDRLMQALRQVRVRDFVLISTVDVYPVPVDVDEDTAIDTASGSPYGRHRRLLENFVQDRFQGHVIRLPGLFGRGLKKNIIFDLLHDNRPDAISPDSVFQFYDLEHIWADIGRFRRHGLHLVNVATEPVSVRTVAEEAFGRRFEAQAPPAAVRYDFHTKFADLLGARNPYLYRREEVLDAMRLFVQDERAR